MRRALCALLLCGCSLAVGLDGEECYLEPGVDVGPPCRLVAPQCGCDEGQACRDGAGCQPAGTRRGGEECAPGANECVAGTQCVTVAGQSRCHAFCNAQTCGGAGPGSFCARFDGAPIGYCTDACVPGRGDCGAQGACLAISTLSACLLAGPRGVGETCSADEPCQDGLTCEVNLSGNRICYRACGPNVLPCPSPSVCQVPIPDRPGVVREPASDEWGICTVLTDP